MAGDWLKIESETPDKPEILAVAAACNLSTDDVFGKCFRLWRWFDSHTDNGNARSVTKTLLDLQIRATGFCDALEKVGWLVVENDSITLPHFDRHNGKTAKTRALAQKRAAKHKNGKVTEESRKSNAARATRSSLLSCIDKESIPELLRDIDFFKLWDKWETHRREIKKPLTKTQADSQLKLLAKKGRVLAERMIEHTIAMGWQGLREPDGPPPPESRVDYTEEDLATWTPHGSGE